MKKQFDSRDYDLDFYNLYLHHYLSEHRFPEADDDLLIAARAENAYDVFVESRLAGDEYIISNEKAMAALYAGFEISPYEFVSAILLDEFADNISLEDESIEFWTYTFLQELAPEFKGVELSEAFLSSAEGEVFRLTIIGRISLFFEKYGL